MNRRLSAALSTLLPTAEQTLLLRACLDETEGAGRGAWVALDHRLGAQGLEPLLRANRRLLPLLHRADGRDDRGLGLPAELCRRLAAVTLRERLRSSAFHRGADEVVQTCLDDGWDVLVLRGAALAEVAYPEPCLRHCHDLDVLVRRSGAGDDHRAVPEELAGRASRHRSAFAHPRAQADDGPLWARGRPLDVGGRRRGMVMGPADLLVHVCGHAYLSESRHTLAWVTDAWFTLAAWPELDWNLVATSAEERHLGMGLALTLGYLSRELGAPVPPDVLGRLERLAVEPVDRDVALALAWGAARRQARSRTKAVLSAGAGAPSLLRWRLTRPSSVGVTHRRSVAGRR